MAIEAIEPDRVLEILRENDGLTEREVAGTLGCSPIEAHNALVKLNVSGEAEAIDPGMIESNPEWRAIDE